MSVVDEAFAVQVLVVGGLLAVAAILKWFAPSGDRKVSRQRATAASELVLAGAVLGLPTSLAVASVALFAVSATVVLARRRAGSSGAGCGCMGRFSDHGPITARTFARLWLLLVLSAPAVRSDVRWYRALPSSVGALSAAAGFVLVALAFPELADAARAFRVRLASRSARSASFDCDTGPVSEAEARAAMTGSAAYRELKGYGLARTPREWWVEGCWVFAAFDCAWESRPAVAVIAGHSSGESRGAIVDAAERTVLYEYRPKSTCGHCAERERELALAGLP